MSKRILAVASAGGHWIQLLRLSQAFENNKVFYVSTKPDFGDMVKGFEYFYVPNSNRWNKFGLVISFFSIIRIVFKVKPEVIITTGAAPGLMAIFAGRIIGARTLWIDSIANVDDMSMSGKIALKFANKVYTQWPSLANEKIVYSGNVISK